jgi:hypothetical protein
MLKKFTAFFIAFLLLIAFNMIITVKMNAKKKTLAATEALLSQIDHARFNADKTSAPLVLGNYEASFETGDARAANLKAFFRGLNSDLFAYADYIVQISDKYGLDYRLIPAISVQESTACKYIPPGSFNCWGWGIYGDKVTKFSSYEEAIETVAKGLRTEYADDGLKTPEEIMKRYNPSSPGGAWAKGVNKAFGWVE